MRMQGNLEPDPESGIGLSKHLHEMLEMRGQELDEAKKRLQNFKEKARCVTITVTITLEQI